MTMTREVAIGILEMSKHMATSGRLYNQAIDMAIEALSEPMLDESIKAEICDYICRYPCQFSEAEQAYLDEICAICPLGRIGLHGNEMEEDR